MPVIFFDNAGNQSVIEQMIAEMNIPPPGQADRLEKLRPEDTYRLLDLPSGTILKLAAMLGIEDIRELMDRLWRADNEDDLGALGSGINFLNRRVILAAYPGGSSPEFLDRLSLSMSNFIILWQALYNYLKDGVREVEIEWSDTVGLDSLPRGHRIPFLLAYDWLSMTLMFIDLYLESHLGGNHMDSPETLPLPIVAIQPEGEPDEEGELLGYAVGIHKQGQSEYEVWLRLFFSGEVDFSFVPLWDEPVHVQKLMDSLAELESDIRSTMVNISSSWKMLPRAEAEDSQADSSSILGSGSKSFDPKFLVRYRFGRPQFFRP
jgi:hypothetical protein